MIISAYAASCEGSTVVLPGHSAKNLIDILLIAMAHAVVATGQAAQGNDLRQFDFLAELSRPGNTRDMATIVLGSICATAGMEFRARGVMIIDELDRQLRATEVVQ